MSAVVNLTALAEARAKMTPGEYTYDVIDGITSGRPDSARRMGICDRYMRATGIRACGDGLVATHNAADVLIEVVRTAIEADAALAAFEKWIPDPTRLADDEFVPLLNAARAARAAHRAALAKVSL